MKTTTWLRLLCLVLGLTFAATAHASQRWETLEAIHWVENPTNSTRLGPCGELGPYQFRRSTWQMYTNHAFSLAINRAESDRVAVAHYDWIKRQLEDYRVPATTYNIALVWNAGLDAVVSGRVPAASRDYATRVTNLAEDLKRSQLASGG